MFGHKNLHLLARAVIQSEGCILLAQARGAANTFLPGGHVDPGEGLTHCLERELFEELGVRSRAGHYLGAIEHLWHDDTARPHYEVNHVFEVVAETLSAAHRPISREAHLAFLWVPLGELDAYNLEPHPLRELLSSSSKGVQGTWWASTLR